MIQGWHIMIQNVDLYKSNKIQQASGSEASTVQAGQGTQAFSEVLDAVHTEKKEAVDTNTMEDIFIRASEKHQVPINLLKSVAKAESNFNPDAVSHCGAQGVMQLMPSTAEGLGVKDAFDPEENIMGGAKYLSMMLNQYDGDVKLALAAYNAGSGNVAKYGGIPPFKETQAYVKKVTAYMEEEMGVISVKVESKAGAAQGKTTQPLFMPLTQADLDYTYQDYVRFMELYQEQKSWNQMMALYKNR